LGDQVGDLGPYGLEFGLQPLAMLDQRGPEPLEVGMFHAVGFHAQHLLDLVAALAQLAQRGLLGALRGIERQGRRQAVLGDEAGIDGIGLGQLAVEAGIKARAAAVGAVDAKTELGCGLEHMAFVAAGGFTHHQHRPGSELLVAALLGLEQAAHRCGHVGDGLLAIGGQGVHHQGVFTDLEGDDVVEARCSWDHGHGAVRSSWIICGREGLSTVRMAG